MSKWYACVDWNVCRSFEYTPSGSGTVAIQNSVGLNGVNRASDVLEIQKALNRVPPVQGGAEPQLKEDGLSGPMTRGAIRAFQVKQFPGIPPDSRIDPKQRTIARINQILSAPLVQSTVAARSGFSMPVSSAPDAGKPEIVKAFATIPECLTLVRSAIHRLEGRLKRAPVEAEIASELGMPVAEYQDMLNGARGSQLVYLDDLGAGVDDEDYLERHLVVDGAEPAAILRDKRFRQALVDAIEELPEREKLLMSLYHEQDMNLREIGGIMGVTESRVCQLHSQAISRLRSRLKYW